MYPTNALYLLHKIFTILAYMFWTVIRVMYTMNTGILSQIIHIDWYSEKLGGEYAALTETGSRAT